MKKVFKLARAEFGKIFYRPSIFILTALLIITLVVSNFFFAPTLSTTKLEYVAENVAGVYEQFTSSSDNKTTKSTIDKMLDDTKKQIDDTYYKLVSIDKYSEFCSNVLLVVDYYKNDFLQNLFYIVQIDSNKFDESATQNTLKKLKEKCSDFATYLTSEVKDNVLNFYMQKSDYDFMYQTIINLHDDIPNTFADYKHSDYISRCEIIRNKYKSFIEGEEGKPSKLDNVVNSLKKFTLDAKTLNEDKIKYYDDAKQKLENTYLKNINELYATINTSNKQEDMDNLNAEIAKYYSYASMNAKILENKFMLYRIGEKNDSELADLVGYEEVSKYALTEEIQKYQYLLDNEKFDYNYLSSFNFNVASSATTNAWDYTFYSLQILSVLIIVFSIFYACTSIAGDQSSGTMKMIAIRPYTRNKIFAGKYMSCLIFAILLLVVSFVASFVVGAVSYGITLSPCLVVFNSTVVMEISPIIMMLIYIVSLILKIMFYISLAMILSLIFKSTTLSVFVSALISIVGVVVNGLVSSVALAFTPFGHLDLFKYFGNSKLGLFSNNILPDTNFIMSLAVVLACIVVLNIISHFMFKRRDIA
ncbi:MAG: ABC transporter permease subunit [Clostridia bacterium]|nr:ABC transporter permease subunit [Clostridia bacterium]